MNTVLQFKHPRTGYHREEQRLLTPLCGSVQVMWRDGWAERGDPDGVVVLKNRDCIGVWLHSRGCFAFVPAETGVAQMRAATVDEAYEATLAILGELPEE